jgi:GGDEF domain-containing protein
MSFRRRGPTASQRTGQLATLQEQLRDQADRDWLTGLHNRAGRDRVVAE